jgi:hypothetical protein
MGVEGGGLHHVTKLPFSLPSRCINPPLLRRAEFTFAFPPCFKSRELLLGLAKHTPEFTRATYPPCFSPRIQGCSRIFDVTRALRNAASISMPPLRIKQGQGTLTFAPLQSHTP